MQAYIKKIIKKSIPYKVYSPILYSYRYVKSIAYIGKEFECPFCRGRFDKLLPGGYTFPVLREKNVIGAGYRLNAACPRCFSADRERLILLFLKEKKQDIFLKKIRLLHVAPEARLSVFLKSHDNIDYLSADLDSPLADIKMDITNIVFKDGAFDFIICNHVLEHIPDDARAMSEIFRVLKPGGSAILQVPISYSIPHTIEDLSITDPKDREKVFGQDNHVRLYGRDYKKRLEQVGFTVIADNFIGELARQDIHKYGLIEGELIYLCSKDHSSPALSN